MNTEKITVSEAIAQGYEYCGIDSGDAYQGLIRLVDLDGEHWESGKVFLLADKEPNTFKVAEDFIKDVLTNDVTCNYYDACKNDDIDGISKELTEKLNVSDITKQINDFFEEHPWYMLTKIQLIV